MKHIKFVARHNKKLFSGVGGYEVFIIEQTHTYREFGIADSMHKHVFYGPDEYTLISSDSTSPGRYDSNYAYVRCAKDRYNLTTIQLKMKEYPRFKAAVEAYNEFFKDHI